MMNALCRRSATSGLLVLPVVCAWTVALHAQQAAKIPIRTLAPSTAVSKDSVGPVLAVRALSNGNILVNDLASRRVLWFDATLARSRVVVDTSGGTGPDAPAKVQVPSATLIRYLGD